MGFVFHHESVRDDPNFSFRKTDSHEQKFDKSTTDTSEIKINVFEEVISKKKRKEAKKQTSKQLSQYPKSIRQRGNEYSEISSSN